MPEESCYCANLTMLWPISGCFMGSMSLFDQPLSNFIWPIGAFHNLAQPDSKSYAFTLWESCRTCRASLFYPSRLLPTLFSKARTKGEAKEASREQNGRKRSLLGMYKYRPCSGMTLLKYHAPGVCSAHSSPSLLFGLQGLSVLFLHLASPAHSSGF